METPDYSKTKLNICGKGLTELPADIHLYTHLEELFCDDNKLIDCDNLPQSLKELVCHNNKLTQLDNLPPNLEKLYCWYNQITKLNNLPQSLKVLSCDKNPLQYNFEPTLENIRSYITSIE